MAARPRLSVTEVVEALERLDGPALPDRKFAPLDELVSCILSQHSNDARTYPAFAELRRRFPAWADLMSASAVEIEQVLQPAGLAKAKTQRVRAALSEIHARVGDYSIDLLDSMTDGQAVSWLESLPGVGPKTAAVTLAFAFGRDVLPVDTHVFRVAKRLGWIPERVNEAKSHAVLGKKIPKGMALRTHLALIRHGRTRCTARNPKCSECPLIAGCKWAQEHQIGYHHSASASPKRRSSRMNPPATASTIDSAQKLRCFAAWSYGHAIVRQIDRADALGDFWERLKDDDAAAARVAAVWLSGASLIPALVSDPELRRALLEGTSPTFEVPDRRATPGAVADWARRVQLLAALDALRGTDPGPRLAEIQDELVRTAIGRLSLSLQCVALGEWALNSIGGSVPQRLLCFGHSSTVIEETAMLRSWFDGLKRHGLQGLEIEAVAWTWDGFIKYELEHMPMRERYDLVSVRSVTGDEAFAAQVRRVGFALPLTPERLRELVNMRHRQETEEMRPSHRWRHVSLGYGSLADLLWIVQVHELRFPTATQAGSTIDIPERVRTLARAQLINAVERDELLEAWTHLQVVRYRLVWLGLTPEVVPENPAKLARLALAFGYEDGNAFLAYHQRVVECVRALVDESRERLRA